MAFKASLGNAIVTRAILDLMARKEKQINMHSKLQDV